MQVQEKMRRNVAYGMHHEMDHMMLFNCYSIEQIVIMKGHFVLDDAIFHASAQIWSMSQLYLQACALLFVVFFFVSVVNVSVVFLFDFDATRNNKR